MKVVVDTSIAIDYLRRRDSKESLYTALSSKERLVMSLITVAELYSGKSAQAEGKQRELIEEMLEGIEVVIPSLDTARRVGELRSRYELSLADAFVATLAIEMDLLLATLDKKAFEKITEVKLY